MNQARQDILRVARRAFATIGFQKVTVESIARMANRGRRTVYTYFRNKSEIYTAVVEMELMEIASALSVAASGDGSLREKLSSYSGMRRSRLVELLDRNPLLRKSFLSRHARMESLRDLLDREELKILTALFARHLAGMKQGGSSTPGDYALIFLALLKGSDQKIATGENEIELDKYQELAIDIFLDGSLENIKT